MAAPDLLQGMKGKILGYLYQLSVRGKQEKYHVCTAPPSHYAKRHHSSGGTRTCAVAASAAGSGRTRIDLEPGILLGRCLREPAASILLRAGVLEEKYIKRCRRAMFACLAKKHVEQTRQGFEQLTQLGYNTKM